MSVNTSELFGLVIIIIVCISGKLILVDQEAISLTNLQRYVLTNQKSIGRPKVELIADFFANSGLQVENIPPMNWEAYVQSKETRQFENILICVDNANDRIMVQGALPKKIFNAWTQNENLGISRHIDFINDPCLCCLYFPAGQKKSRSQEIADNLNILDETLIRKYLASKMPLDESLLNLIKEANAIDTDEQLRKFIGLPIDIFYAEVVCGGVLMQLSGIAGKPDQQQMEVPSAFESAFAGILLCAEIIKDKLNYLIPNLASSIRFNLIRSLETVC